MKPVEHRAPESEREEIPLENDRSALIARAPRREDVDALVRIDAAWSGRERRAYLEERLARALRPTGISLARVAERDGEVVGFLFGEVTRGEYGHVGAVAWIDTVGVQRDEVRGGIGTFLLDDFVHHGLVLGAERIWTLLDPADELLTEFFEARGFTMAQTKVVERDLTRGRP